MSALEVLGHLRNAKPDELVMIRDTAESLLLMNGMAAADEREISEALDESAAQFARGEGITAAEVWQRLGI